MTGRLDILTRNLFLCTSVVVVAMNHFGGD